MVSFLTILLKITAFLLGLFMLLGGDTCAVSMILPNPYFSLNSPVMVPFFVLALLLALAGGWIVYTIVRKVISPIDNPDTGESDYC